MFIEVAEVKKEGDILITAYKKGSKVDVKSARDIDLAHTTLASGNDMFIIADLSAGEIELSNQAKDFFLHEGKMMPFTKAVAIVGEIKSRGLMHKIFGKSKSWYDVKKCGSIKEAEQWFNELRKMEQVA